MGATRKKREGTDGRQKFLITSGIRPERQMAEDEAIAFFQKVMRHVTSAWHVLRILILELIGR
jgi:hypothetical protein